MNRIHRGPTFDVAIHPYIITERNTRDKLTQYVRTLQGQNITEILEHFDAKCRFNSTHRSGKFFSESIGSAGKDHIHCEHQTICVK